MFNSNIRCIEIAIVFGLNVDDLGLIVTLDVLKSIFYVCRFWSKLSLIVTLDVLKCFSPARPTNISLV